MAFEAGGGGVIAASYDAAKFFGFAADQSLIGMQLRTLVCKISSRMMPRQREAFEREQDQLFAQIFTGQKPLASVCLVFAERDVPPGGKVDAAYLPIVTRVVVRASGTILDVMYLDVTNLANVDEDGVVRCTVGARRKFQESNPTEVPPDILIDNVRFTLTGPGVLAPGAAHELQFWVHVEQQTSTVLEAASVVHGLPQSGLAVKSEGPYPLHRGSRISVRLKIDGLKCLDNHKWVTWTGEIGNTAFVVEVPPGATERAYPGTASIRLAGLEIARMSFLVRVGPPNLNINEIPSQTTSYRSAFASYASEDRAEVLSRVQGMETAHKGLDVFVDVINLRSGQNWERELVERISKSDVFYLFWCRHAMNSDWVNKEWHWALSAKGQGFIDPVPLETPDLAPPPEELAAKHFNDPLLAFIAAAGGVHSV